jgi:hypothetical protein
MLVPRSSQPRQRQRTLRADSKDVIAKDVSCRVKESLGFGAPLTELLCIHKAMKGGEYMQANLILKL